MEEKSRREKIREEKESEERRCRCAKRWESRETVCFSMVCGSGGSKSRLAKPAGAEPAGQMRDKKLHAVVARKVKMLKTLHVRATFGSWDVEKVHAVVARSTFWSQNVQNTTCTRHFWRFRCRFARQAPGIVHLVKSEQNVRVCSISKKDGRRGTFEDDLQRCIFCGRRSTRDMFIRAVRRSGRWFPEMGCILEHQIFRFAEMILRDRCSTSYDLASFFRGRRNRLDKWIGKIAKRIGTRPSALHSTLHF